MKYGMIGNKHDVKHPQYATWGLFGNKEVSNHIPESTIDEIIECMSTCGIDAKGFTLGFASRVGYFSNGDKKAILLRFERENGENKGLGGEHVSVVYSVQDKKILGFTKMRSELTPEVADITHQEALAIAVEFLQKAAPDLISEEVGTPELNGIDKKERMEFVPACPLGKTQLNWMDDHGELLTLGGKETEIHGMKVKLYIPETELWAWVIIGTDKQVLTFEKNIAWDFEKMQRKTQMWLHDGWLKEHGITLLPHPGQAQEQKQEQAPKGFSCTM